MDNLTHGLIGTAIGVLMPIRGEPRGVLTPTRKAAILAGLLAAELPDLDTLWPAADPVIHALRAHRGISHALVFTPVIAGVATLIARRVFRAERWKPIALTAFVSVLFAHLLADLWTGWGTRLLLPFSDQRLTLDWAMVVDPLITLPLLIAAIWAARRPERWRRAAIVGLTVASAYLGARVVIRAVAKTRLARSYPEATRIEVFPAWLSLFTWRYVAVLPETYAAGEVSLTGAPEEQRVVPIQTTNGLSEQLLSIPTVHEAIAWARLPLVSSTTTSGETQLRIADLRYHLRGEPTLTFVISVSPSGEITEAKLERGGSARDLLERWRGKR